MADNFIDIPFEKSNLDRYIVRTSILQAITERLPILNGKLLDAGCGKMPYKEFILSKSNVEQYVGLDIDSALVYDSEIGPDITWDGKIMPFDNNSFNSCMATEVLEHCPEPEVFLKEVHRVLMPGGIIFFTVPFLWPLHEVPHDEYRYTPFSLQRHLENSGFTQIEISSLGGWNASLAQMMGLWVRRSPMSSKKRSILSKLFLPVIKHLLKTDLIPEHHSERNMVTGFAGVAYKPQ
ncbi:class I SAM-dependent methyltransferase [Cognataquiflexum rubidum]|uniref:class I SAM-dependent methyltransferase n=1 Tax=Cognataquiflexum rubidum TaxID=2922273 RepID=UPI001F12FEB4|nr:class I SAM-dependent methyltransferase [Cognataquiflexum rubidum]MCH6236515.1 class I SAM-dependent methyltransferase [Cognataquiflexum rubidum]